MGMTMAEKILAAHAQMDEMSAGQLADVLVDVAFEVLSGFFWFFAGEECYEVEQVFARLLEVAYERPVLLLYVVVEVDLVVEPS